MSFLYAPRPYSLEEKRTAVSSIIAGATPDRDYYLLLIGAILFATSGILLDSLPVLIASMLVAPLGGPLIGLSLGFSTRNSDFFTRSLGMFICSVVITLLLGGIGGYIGHNIYGISTDRIFISFSPNYFFDIFIALISGFIAAYGHMRLKASDAITGVGIAVSLLPPLVATGIGLATSDFTLASDSFIIFISNVLAVLVAGIITFRFFGFHKINNKK